MLRKGEAPPPNDQQYVPIINLLIKMVDSRIELLKMLIHAYPMPADESLTYLVKIEVANLPVEIPGFNPQTPSGKQVCERYRTSLIIYQAIFKRFRTLYKL